MTDMLPGPSSYMLRHLIARQQRQYWADVGWLPDGVELTAAPEWYVDWPQPGEWFMNSTAYKALNAKVDRMLARHGIGNRDYWLNPMLPAEPDSLDTALDNAIAAFEKGSGYVPRGMVALSAPLAYRIRRGYRLRVELPAPVRLEDTVPRRPYVRRYRNMTALRALLVAECGTKVAAYLLDRLVIPNPFA